MQPVLRTVDVKAQLRMHGYSLVRSAELPLNPEIREHEPTLAEDWNNLELDNYLRGARFRERRWGRYCYMPTEHRIRLMAHRPYFQSTTANGYAGGIHRVVAPLAETSVRNPLLDALIEFNYAQFPVARELGQDAWEVACHQFRIIARPGEPGEPTPEGIHRDEIDFGAIHLISRSNVEGGYSKIYDNDKREIASFCLESRMDTLFWADHDVLHATTSIKQIDADSPAIRDILILGYKHAPELRDAM
jgi:hypothetical protein